MTIAAPSALDLQWLLLVCAWVSSLVMALRARQRRGRAHLSLVLVMVAFAVAQTIVGYSVWVDADAPSMELFRRASRYVLLVMFVLPWVVFLWPGRQR